VTVQKYIEEILAAEGDNAKDVIGVYGL